MELGGGGNISFFLLYIVFYIYHGYWFSPLAGVKDEGFFFGLFWGIAAGSLFCFLNVIVPVIGEMHWWGGDEGVAMCLDPKEEGEGIHGVNGGHVRRMKLYKLTSTGTNGTAFGWPYEENGAWYCADRLGSLGSLLGEVS